MPYRLLVVALVALAGCASQPPAAKAPAVGLVSPAPVATPPAAPPTPPVPAAAVPVASEPTKPAEPVPDLTQPETTEPPPVPVAKPAPVTMPWLKASGWNKLPGWGDDDLRPAWPAQLESCKGLKANPAWIPICLDAARLPPLPENSTLRDFFEQHFQPWQVNQAEGGVDGLVTGYYEPLLRGSRQPTPTYRFPIYAAPDDLLIVDLAALYPELKNLRLRGRLQGKKVVPYYSRSEIEAGQAPVRGKELVWVDDAVELFFLQIQGSGRVRMEDGETLRIGYADQNGHPYRSIGKWLVEKGELTLDKASMQGIKDWGQRNLERLPELLNANPSYVFFRELPAGNGGPLGALGVPLTPERSVAVDPRAIPLGAPLWLDTTRPNSEQPLQRLMLAQDTGGAIRGNVRADFFWGFGDEAGKLAGAMKQKGRIWLLLPKDFPLGNR